MTLCLGIPQASWSAPMSVSIESPQVIEGPGKFRLKLGPRLKRKIKRNLATAENPRLTAALLTLLAGPFGMHRLYLGTEVNVPVIYTCTLGGGLGILPIIDLFVILFSKDLEAFYNNSRVIMWGGSN